LIYEQMSEVYNKLNNVTKMITYILKAKDEFEKIKDGEEKSRLLQNTYNNLGIAYLDNLDSCTYYFNKAALLINKKSQKNTIASIYFGLGYISGKKKHFKEAIDYFKKSIQISKSVKNLEFEAGANSQLAQVYYNINDSINGNIYKNNSLKLNDSISKRKVDATVDVVRIIENESVKKSKNTKYILILIIGIIVFLFFFLGKMLLKKRKDEIIVKRERDKLIFENTALEKEISSIDNPTINEIELLVILAKKDSSIFYVKFQEVFSNFNKRIVEIAPTLVLSEMQLCAFLKLNFSTKEIAIFTKSSVESINQKKYRLRKKMNIPSDEDMNIWMSKY
jgi:tetratricopeptide (TPR) repeat protein